MSKKNVQTNANSYYVQVKSGEFAKCMKTIEKIAKSVSEEEFSKFLKTKELPTIKLTQADMKNLNGGWFWKVLEFMLKPLSANANDTGYKFSSNECGELERSSVSM